MKKILFYTANGVGLGHLQRTRLIAQELRSKNVKIILVTPARSPHIFGKFFHELIRLTPLSDKLLDDSSRTFDTRLSNGQRFSRALKKFKPDVVVADFHLTSPFTFYAFGAAMDYLFTKSIFIWRLEDTNTLRRDLKRETNRLSYFQKIIIPHGRQELKDLLPPYLLKKIESDTKFKICGPIFRKFSRNKIVICRDKYKIGSKDFLILVTLGGGGKFEKGKCEKPDKIIKKFLAIYPRLADEIPNLKTIIVTGPYFKNFIKKDLLRLKIVRFEKNLPELMALSNLVISTAGYNTCNELIMAKTPAILVPLLRGAREQFERASYFQRKGIIKIFSDGSSLKLFNLIIDCKNNLDKMKSNFKKFCHWKQGNTKVARIILNLLKK